MLITAGIILAELYNLVIKFWRRSEEANRRKESEAVLARHGMNAHLYLATVGIEDGALRRALDQFAWTGHIVLDRNGKVVGKIVPKMAKGPDLRLVVDNTQ